MKAFMTNGTLPFLKKLANKHTNITFYFMENEASTLAYYEGIRKQIFVAGREFQAIIKSGDLQEHGFVSMEHIPIHSDSQSIFENRFTKLKETIMQTKGVQALRLLKPKKGNTYVIFIQWRNKGFYENWLEDKPEISIKSPAYFGERRFTTLYHMVEEEEED